MLIDKFGRIPEKGQDVILQQPTPFGELSSLYVLQLFATKTSSNKNYIFYDLLAKYFIPFETCTIKDVVYQTKSTVQIQINDKRYENSSEAIGVQLKKNDKLWCFKQHDKSSKMMYVDIVLEIPVRRNVTY